MSNAVVVDTNVGVVANGGHAAASLRCQEQCANALRDARSRLVLIDDRQLVFTEYRQHLSPSGQPGLGDAFFQWLWDNQANPRHCRQISITPRAEDEADFEEFPADSRLTRFDRSDRKFVAVAIASGIESEILNASDTDWWHFRDALESNGLRLRFLCPELMNGTPK